MRLLTISLLLTISMTLFAQTRQLSEFNGDSVQIGLFGEPMAETFYTQDFSTAFDSGMNYSTSFKVPNYKSKHSAYLINDNIDDIDIVVSSLTKEGDYKNFLVTVPGMDSLELDISPLNVTDNVTVMSLSSFQVQLDKAVVKNNKGTQNPIVFQPQHPEQQGLINDCLRLFSRYIKVANRAPALPGAKFAVAHLFQNANHFTVEYPIATFQAYHVSYDAPGCESTYDSLVTFSDVSGRTLTWLDIVGLMKLTKASAVATCEYSSLPGDSCLVPETSSHFQWDITIGQQ